MANCHSRFLLTRAGAFRLTPAKVRWLGSTKIYNTLLYSGIRMKGISCPIEPQNPTLEWGDYITWTTRNTILEWENVTGNDGYEIKIEFNQGTGWNLQRTISVDKDITSYQQEQTEYPGYGYRYYVRAKGGIYSDWSLSNEIWPIPINAPANAFIEWGVEISHPVWQLFCYWDDMSTDETSFDGILEYNVGGGWIGGSSFEEDPNVEFHEDVGVENASWRFKIRAMRHAVPSEWVYSNSIPPKV